MQIATDKFGIIEVDEETIFTFVKPIIGFDEDTQYIIVEYDEHSPFKWLQSVTNKSLAFPVAFANTFNIDYTFTLSDEDAETVELENVDDLLVLNIVTIPTAHPENATMNLLSPIVMNFATKKAMQSILCNSNFSSRHPLFPEHATIEV